MNIPSPPWKKAYQIWFGALTTRGRNRQELQGIQRKRPRSVQFRANQAMGRIEPRRREPPVSVQKLGTGTKR
jgi:hypothetical protein